MTFLYLYLVFHLNNNCSLTFTRLLLRNYWTMSCKLHSSRYRVLRGWVGRGDYIDPRPSRRAVTERDPTTALVYLVRSPRADHQRKFITRTFKLLYIYYKDFGTHKNFLGNIKLGNNNIRKWNKIQRKCI